MTIREKLIQEIEQTPDILLNELLNFLLFTKERYEGDDITPEEHEEIMEAQEAYASGNYVTLQEFIKA